MKNRVLLENCNLPGALEQAISQFIDHYNHHRCHESIGNVTPADAHFGRGPQILEERRNIKEETLKQRRFHNQAQAAYSETRWPELFVSTIPIMAQIN